MAICVSNKWSHEALGRVIVTGQLMFFARVLDDALRDIVAIPSQGAPKKYGIPSISSDRWRD
jgi:hypothetical protein